MKTFTLAGLSSIALLLSGCMTPADNSAEDPAATETTTADLTTQSCTPGHRSCDFGCFYVGGPSSDDCIVQCNASGTGYTLVQSCGWAQNFPYSSSCLDTPTQPVCKWN